MCVRLSIPRSKSGGIAVLISVSFREKGVIDLYAYSLCSAEKVLKHGLRFVWWRDWGSSDW